MTTTQRVDHYLLALDKMEQVLKQPNAMDEAVAFLHWILDCIKGRQVDDRLRRDINGFHHVLTWSVHLERVVVDSPKSFGAYPRADVLGSDHNGKKFLELVLKAHSGTTVDADWRALCAKQLSKAIGVKRTKHALNVIARGNTDLVFGTHIYDPATEVNLLLRCAKMGHHPSLPTDMYGFRQNELRPFMFRVSWDAFKKPAKDCWDEIQIPDWDPRRVLMLANTPSFDELYAMRGQVNYGWDNDALVLTSEKNVSVKHNRPIFGLWSLRRIHSQVRLVVPTVDVLALRDEIANAATEGEALDAILSARTQLKHVKVEDYFAYRKLCEHLR